MITTINEIDFNIETQINNENETKNLFITPNPSGVEKFQAASQILDTISLEILWSKHSYGIAQRTDLFTDVYKKFEEISSNCSGIDDYIKMNALFCDMFLKFGTIIEDFAGMCSAFREFSIHGTSISEYFLAYSDPIGFYNSIVSGNSRNIKQIFRLPQAKLNLNKIFVNISDEERDVIWKGIQNSSQMIFELYTIISQSIVRKTPDSVTYYDFYNKVKHGFAPIFPFALPIEISLEGVPLERSNEDILQKYFFETVMIVHDKLKGQRTPNEQIKYDSLKLASPAHTWESINLEQATTMLDIVKDIDLLYKHLVKTYLSFSQGNKKLSILIRPDLLTKEEEELIYRIITNDSFYR
ncbi:hypothetical protein [Paenibacillus piscarius]|uniref:hypothetical protein n=1 Tax=Paenibacillus piscarius TaxID=1089681 RepID=UPI001EE7C905|nr:hypothetical protein [Paenibacillus piscarius]